MTVLFPSNGLLKKPGTFDAWELSSGDKEIIIGLVDTGIDYNHPDLKKNLFINSLEDLNKNGRMDSGDFDGIDNDENGFIDDVLGFDFTNRAGIVNTNGDSDFTEWDNDPMDQHGHGTNVAGIIGAESNNRIGIAGVVPNVRILNARAFDPTGYGEEDDVASAILYAVSMGARIINMSFGDSQFSNLLQDVIKFAYDKGVILIGSSGNSASSELHFPSGFSQVISVGSSDINDDVSSFSNFGSTLDLIAPGSRIITSDLNSRYGFVNGTSASAPFVSGAAALILSIERFDTLKR